MIKNKLLTGCLLALASAHAFSASQPGFYMSAKAGAGLLAAWFRYDSRCAVI